MKLSFEHQKRYFNEIAAFQQNKIKIKATLLFVGEDVFTPKRENEIVSKTNSQQT